MRTPLAVLLTAAVLLGLAVGASAHEQPASTRAVLDRVEPFLPGVTVSVGFSIATELIIENPTATELTVVAASGEPFLLIGPGGVLANLNSASWYLTNSPTGTAVVPDRARQPHAQPDWARISSRPSWGWFDHRLHPTASTADTLLGQAPGAHLAEWSVPLRFGSLESRAIGHLEFRPTTGSIVASLASPATALPGVTVSLLQGSWPGLFVDSTAGQPVTILGADGEPFARIGPDGTEVNVHSPVYAADLQARGQAPSEDVDPSSPPEWRQTSKSPKMGWLDLRARPATLEPADPGRRTVLADWTIPVEAAGQRAEIRGVTTYVPLHETAGGLAVVWIVIVGALIGVGLGISARLLTLRYRRPTAR